MRKYQYVTMNYHVRLTKEQFTSLRERLASRFKFLVNQPWHQDVTYKPRKHILTFKFSIMGRSLYPDESSEAHPFRLGKEVTIDSIRVDQISCFLNGYFFGAGI